MGKWKDLTFATEHVGPDNVDINVIFLIQVSNSTAETIFKEDKKIIKEDLNSEAFFCRWYTRY